MLNYLILWTNLTSDVHTCLNSDICLRRADSETGIRFSITCPSGCQSQSDRLWGTGTYTSDSYICSAAIHAGSITGCFYSSVSTFETVVRTVYWKPVVSHLANQLPVTLLIRPWAKFLQVLLSKPMLTELLHKKCWRWPGAKRG